MRVEITELHWLGTGQPVSLSALVQTSGLRDDEVHELVEYGVLVPLDAAAKSWDFPADQLGIARTARRLRDDFDLGAQGLAVALTLLERVRDLEERLRQLDAQLPRPPF